MIAGSWRAGRPADCGPRSELGYFGQGELHDFFDAGGLAALGDYDAVEGAAGFESFADGVNAVRRSMGREFSVERLKLKVLGGG